MRNGRHTYSANNYRNSGGNIAEFAPALIVIFISFVAILSLMSVLCFEAAAQRACAEASAGAANSLTASVGAKLVEQRADQFNASFWRVFIANQDKKPFVMHLLWDQSAPEAAEEADLSAKRYARVVGECVIQPLGMPIKIEVKPRAQTLIEHPEGWSNEADE